MINNRLHKKGFTLVEVLVSLSVLIMVVVSATSLLVSSIRTNADNIDVIVAYGLAQEGLEAVRNIRDSNWLLGADFRKGGVITSSGGSIWGGTLPTVPNLPPVYYTLEYKNPGSFFGSAGTGGNAGDSSVSFADAPWSLETLTYEPGGCADSKDLQFACSPKTLLYKKKTDPNANAYAYTTSGIDAVPTNYHRFVSIQMVPHTINGSATILANKIYLVTSHVTWNEYGTNREVVLTTELTDWKEI